MHFASCTEALNIKMDWTCSSRNVEIPRSVSVFSLVSASFSSSSRSLYES
jgi:hypothetical protein